ncbi:unnamed protein product [Choristocarpus tenellus]
MFLHSLTSPLEDIPSSLLDFRHIPPDGGRDTNESGQAQMLEIGLAEESDLDDVAALLVEVFSQDVILADKDFSELEKTMISGPLEMTNAYFRAVAYLEVLYTLRSRCGNRLRCGNLGISSDAVLIVIRNPAGEGAVVGVVELGLRKPDGTLPTNWPFPNPWRREEPTAQAQPYMCNLAVSEESRGQGHGKQLVRLCEHIAHNCWRYGRMYLHVDLGNPVASGLYKAMGYQSMEEYDAPMWMRQLLGLPTIRYQCKRFASSSCL